jgi:hypothetical protein
LKDRNPRTGEAIWNALPFESKAQLWGEEIYFKIPVILKLENPQVKVEVGDVAYWPPEHCMCIFFGRTPSSINNKPRAYSPVNVFGRVINNVKILKNVKEGEKLRIEKA